MIIVLSATVPPGTRGVWFSTCRLKMPELPSVREPDGGLRRESRLPEVISFLRDTGNPGNPLFAPLSHENGDLGGNVHIVWGVTTSPPPWPLPAGPPSRPPRHLTDTN